MRCVWAPQVPSRNPTPQSLLLGVQGPPGPPSTLAPRPPFFTLSATPGNRELRTRTRTHPSWGPASPGLRPLPSPPAPAVSCSFGHRGGEGQQGEEAGREEASALHPEGRAWVRVPPGAAGVVNPPTLPQFPGQAQGLGCYCGDGGLGGAGPSPPARRCTAEESPRGLLEPGTQLRPPPGLRTPAGQPLGPRPPRTLRGPARSLARCPRAPQLCSLPRRAVPLRPPRPFCLKNRSEPVTWAPAPPH